MTNRFLRITASAAVLGLAALSGVSRAFAQSTPPAPAAPATPAVAKTPAVPAGPIGALSTARTPRTPAPAPDLACVNVDRLQVNLAPWVLVAGKDGAAPTLVASSKEHVALDFKGNRARVEQFDMVAVNPGKPAPAPSVLVSDGTHVTEYSGGKNVYFTGDAKPLTAQPASRTGLVPMGLGVVLGWTRIGFTAAPEETVDGTAYAVLSHSSTFHAAPDSKAPARGVEYKILVDKATKLPVRYTVTTIEGETSKIVQRVDFSDWQINSGITDSLFAYSPPSGATPYVAPVLLTAGATAPDFTVEKWGGGNVKLSDYRGKVVVLDFWATWCGPCQRSMPHVQRVADSIKGQDVVVLGVCVWDEKAPYEKWVPANQSKYTFQFAFDPAGRGDDSLATKGFGVTGIPTTYIIDKDGKVAEAVVGFSGDSDKRLEAALTKIGVKVPGEPETKVAAK